MRGAQEPLLDPRRYPFVHRVRVRFAETDAMGVVHHAAYLPYLESARVEWLRALGRPYTRIRAEGFDLAVIEVGVRYLAPLRFDEEADVHVRLARIGPAAFTLHYLLRRADAAVATASTRHALLGADDGRPRRLPDWTRALAEAR
jgi:acyl-CoA thioester hydrolase